MFVIPNSTDNKFNTTTTISVNTNFISLAVHPFLAKKDTRFKVL